MVLEEDEGRHQTSFFSSEEVDDLLRGGAVVLDLAAVAARRRVAEREHLGLRAGLADVVGVDAEVGERERLLRLRLRAHDPLQRRVARLVDRVGDRDHGRERRLDPVVAELGLALHGRLAVGDRRARQPARRAAAGAARRRRPRARRRRSRRTAGRRARGRGSRARAPWRAHGSSRRDRSRPRPSSLTSTRAVGAHRERLAQRVERALAGPIETSTTSPSPSPSFSAQRLLDRVRVEGVERAVAGAVEPLRLRVDPARRAAPRAPP